MQDFKITESEVSSEDEEEDTNKPRQIDRLQTFRAAALSPSLSICFLVWNRFLQFIADVFPPFFQLLVVGDSVSGWECPVWTVERSSVVLVGLVCLRRLALIVPAGGKSIGLGSFRDGLGLQILSLSCGIYLGLTWDGHQHCILENFNYLKLHSQTPSGDDSSVSVELNNGAYVSYPQQRLRYIRNLSYCHRQSPFYLFCLQEPFVGCFFSPIDWPIY